MRCDAPGDSSGQNRIRHPAPRHAVTSRLSPSHRAKGRGSARWIEATGDATSLIPAHNPRQMSLVFRHVARRRKKVAPRAQLRDKSNNKTKNPNPSHRRLQTYGYKARYSAMQSVRRLLPPPTPPPCGSSALVHHLVRALILDRLQQLPDLAYRLGRHVPRHRQRLRRFNFVPHEPVHPRQLEDNVGFVRRRIAKQLQVMGRGLFYNTAIRSEWDDLQSANPTPAPEIRLSLTLYFFMEIRTLAR